MALLSVAGMSLCSLFSRNLRFLFFLTFLLYSKDSAVFVRGGAKTFFLAGFAFLGLDSLERGFFAVVP